MFTTLCNTMFNKNNEISIIRMLAVLLILGSQTTFFPIHLITDTITPQETRKRNEIGRTTYKN